MGKKISSGYYHVFKICTCVCPSTEGHVMSPFGQVLLWFIYVKFLVTWNITSIWYPWDLKKKCFFSPSSVLIYIWQGQTMYWHNDHRDWFPTEKKHRFQPLWYWQDGSRVYSAVQQPGFLSGTAGSLKFSFISFTL